MKKQVVTLVALAGLVAGASLAYGAAGSNGGGIVLSKHDMNVFLAGDGKAADKDGRVCAFCHTPHHAQGTNDTTSIDYLDDQGATQTINYRVYSPLWSRQAINVKPEFAQYISASFNPGASGVPYDALVGPSRLCMTCHDGATAVDSYYGQTSSSGIKLGDDKQSMFGDDHFAIGEKATGLSNDHPVGMRYSDFYTKSFNGTSYELKDPAVSTFAGSGTTKTINAVLFNDSIGGDAMGFLTCASCHDVHNGKEVGNISPPSGRGYFLRDTQFQSALCIVCHDKNS